jgi:hypothetical protein
MDDLVVPAAKQGMTHQLLQDFPVFHLAETNDRRRFPCPRVENHLGNGCQLVIKPVSAPVAIPFGLELLITAEGVVNGVVKVLEVIEHNGSLPGVRGPAGLCLARLCSGRRRRLTHRNEG